jgi:hypothetical protein
MRVLGLDTAMVHIGWQALDVAGWPRHDAVRRVDGGTLHDRCRGQSLVRRCWAMAARAHQVVEQQRPDLLVVEDAIYQGQRRSPTGLTVLALVLQHYLPDRGVGHQPRYVVLLHPARLHSLAYQGVGKGATATVDTYYEHAQDPPARVTEHEADAYFLAYYGARFLRSCVEPHPDHALTPEEVRCFRTVTARNPRTKVKTVTAMSHQENIAWWRCGIDFNTEKQ